MRDAQSQDQAMMETGVMLLGGTILSLLLLASVGLAQIARVFMNSTEREN